MCHRGRRRLVEPLTKTSPRAESGSRNARRPFETVVEFCMENMQAIGKRLLDDGVAEEGQ